MARLWRINLKPGSKPGHDAPEFCLERGIVGIGWRVAPDPTCADDYMTRARVAYKQGRGWTVAANALLHRMKIGDLVWTRDRRANYFLGRIASDWKHESGADFQAVDIANVRECRWMSVGTVDGVPGAVVNAFRASSTVQRVADPTALRFSQMLFSKLSGEPYERDLGSPSDLFQLLSADDLEDVAALFVQATQRCVMLPSTCKRDTMNVECILTRLEDGARVGLQVKSGQTSISRDDFNDFQGTVYLVAASGKYLGSERDNVVCVEPDELRRFVVENRKLLPQRIQRWIEYLDSNES